MPAKPKRGVRTTTTTRGPSKNPFEVVGNAASGAYSPTTSTTAASKKPRAIPGTKRYPVTKDPGANRAANRVNNRLRKKSRG